MAFYEKSCKNCGGDLNQIGDGQFKCAYCGSVFAVETVEKHMEELHRLFGDSKLEAISNARKNLYDAVNAEYISSQLVHECCMTIKQLIPDDFQANFYETAIGSNGRRIAKAIRRIDVKENSDCVETMIKFLLASLQSEYILETGDLIDRAYKGTDLVKYEKYSTELSLEAEKLDDCVYMTSYPRDVFVAYSSKDMNKVFELVECLEEQGFSCFVAARNLRHGKGAVENYDKALREAMDNCRSFVFVSSMNSRRPGCDALRKEIPYIKSLDIEKGTSLQEGGAHYNFTGPQGFGIANMTDALLAMKTLVFDEKKVTMAEMKQALADNFGKGYIPKKAIELTTEVAKQLDASGVEVTADTIKQVYTSFTEASHIPSDKKARYDEILKMIEALPKYGNDIPEVDSFAREVGNTYTKPFEHFTNNRGGIFQAGLYPVSANVPLGYQTGATPDGRLAYTPIADGVGPASGRDVKGPTATANSVARLDHGIASNGTLFNQKFHPSALSGMASLEKFVAYLRGYFDQKGMHVQYNVVSRETLIDAQKNPEKYKTLVVRVAGYSALFTTLSRSLQDDIINRTEQGNI